MKGDTITLRLDEKEDQFLKDAMRAIKSETGLEPTRTWVIEELIRLGKPLFRKKYEKLLRKIGKSK